MTKAELKRINKESYDFLKSRSGNKVELDYHMHNIASALSDSFDWLNPEANYDAHSKHNEPYFTDWTKPLPLQGFADKPKIPYRFFFNYDLRYLQHDIKTSTDRYKSSLRISVPAARYELPDIEETTPIFSKSVV